MEDTIKQRVKEILGNAEADIRTLLSEAALTGSVQDISRLADIAKQLNNMGERPEGETRYDTGDDYTCIREGTSAPSEAPADNTTRSRKSQSKRSKKNAYPKFHWENNGQTLVKTGWSKKKRREYRHKASKNVLDLLEKKLEKLGRNGNIITMNDILPLKDEQSGSEISSYKVYICLAYLESQGKTERGPEGITVKQ